MRKTLQSQPPHAVTNLGNLTLYSTNVIVKLFKEGEDKAAAVENIMTLFKDVGLCHGRHRYIVKNESAMAKLAYLTRDGGIDSCELFKNLGEIFYSTFFLNCILFLNPIFLFLRFFFLFLQV